MNKPNIVRFCMVSVVEDGTCVLGDYDMTDWEKGWDKVWSDCSEKAEQLNIALDCVNVLRIDQAMDLWLDLQIMLEREMELINWRTTRYD